jgi:V-ATPase subunit C
MAARDDEDLKKLAIKYNEKTLALSTLQRKKTINVSTSDFEDFMKPSSVARLDLIDSETLLTVMVVVPSSLEKGETARILTTRISLHIRHAQSLLNFSLMPNSSLNITSCDCCRLLKHLRDTWIRNCCLRRAGLVGRHPRETGR